MFDVAIIGGGPAGLSAAIGASCEGLETIMIADRLGGQAGTSSRIENVMGFPEGVSGPRLRDLSCRQVQKFGGVIHEGRVARVEQANRSPFILFLEGGEIIRAKTIVVACGAHYVEPEWANDVKHGVHYVCTAETVRHAGHEHVAVVGGGNSAGQAAEFLSTKCAKVSLVVRGAGLELTMSHYLYNRIGKHNNIELLTHTNTKRLIGDDKGHLIGMEFDDGRSIEVSDVYVMIGSTPNCAFLGDLVETDERGFVKTHGHFETKTPGIYAVGDIRSDSIKRVANACGEGAACIQGLFHFLKGQ